MSTAGTEFPRTSNESVEGLVNLGDSVFSTYPIDVTTDTNHAASDHESGGDEEITHNNLTLGGSDHHTRYSDEEAQDAVGTIMGSFFTYDDAGNSITFDEGEVSHDAIDQSTVSSGDHHTRYSDEEAQDAVGATFDSTLSYDDGANTSSVAESNLDPTSMDGSGGSSGQFLQTDGTNISWSGVGGIETSYVLATTHAITS